MKKLKAVLSLLLTLALITALPSTFAATGGAPNLDTASSWARPLIVEACELGFVTAEILDNYQQPITRAEFCRLAVRWVEHMADKSAETIIKQRGYKTLTFSDTTDPAIIAASALGITSGVGDGKFGMDTTFDRQQAAGMTLNTYEVLNYTGRKALPGYEVTPEQATWSDMGSVSEFTKAGVEWMTQLGFFSGVGDNNFGPEKPFSREQAIILFGTMAKDKPIYPWKAATESLTKEELEAGKTGPFGTFDRPVLLQNEESGSNSGNKSDLYLLDDDVTIPVLLQLLESLRVYVNKAGKLCLDVDFPELPEGFDWYFHAELSSAIDDWEYYTSYGFRNRTGTDFLYKSNFEAIGFNHIETTMKAQSYENTNVEIIAQIIGPDSASTWFHIASERRLMKFPALMKINENTSADPYLIHIGFSHTYMCGPVYQSRDTIPSTLLPVKEILMPYDYDVVFSY